MTEYGLISIPGAGPAREALLREVIAYGGSEEMLRKFFDCEQIARDLVDQLDQLDKRERAFSDGVRVFSQSVAKFMDACGRLVDGEEEREAEQVRQDEEEKARTEAKELERWLAEHPEPGASTDDTHQPSGELHSLDPVDKEHLDPEGSEDDQGALPNELQKGAPPSSGTYVEPEPSKLGGPQDPKQVPQPVSSSFW
jgi:hypothetical protein